MPGIVSFGGYLPWLYLDRKRIFSAMGWFSPATYGVARGQKAVANHDEDSLTMAVAAARDCVGSDGAGGGGGGGGGGAPRPADLGQRHLARAQDRPAALARRDEIQRRRADAARLRLDAQGALSRQRLDALDPCPFQGGAEGAVALSIDQRGIDRRGRREEQRATRPGRQQELGTHPGGVAQAQQEDLVPEPLDRVQALADPSWGQGARQCVDEDLIDSEHGGGPAGMPRAARHDSGGGLWARTSLTHDAREP